jgi:hypothetical protein
MRQLVHFVEREAVLEGIADVPDTLRPRLAQFLLQFLAVGGALVHAVDADFQAAQRFLERLLEGTADRHDLADRLHLRRQARIGSREFLEGETRNLGDHVVDRRFERGGCLAAGDFVGQFVERVADSQLGRNLGDRETRCL